MSSPRRTAVIAGIFFVVAAVAAKILWQPVLGDPQYGWSGWLNPLRDMPARAEADVSKDASS